MDKSEPALVPQWLRNNGTASDDHLKSKVERKNSLSNNDQNVKRSSFSERITSSYSRWSSSTNPSDNLPTSNTFSRNQRYIDWNGDICETGSKDRSVLGDFRRLDYSDPLGNNVLSRAERKSLRRSQSRVSDQPGETWPRKVETGSKGAYKVDSTAANPMIDNGIILHKTSFEREFPSLGVDEKSAPTKIKRIPSPGFIPPIHNFPVAASTIVGSNKWTSALAEVSGAVRSNEADSLPVKAAAPSLPSVSLNVVIGPSMAETVAQGPPRVQTTPQFSTETQRHELAIKQSRQLIPVTPTLPKTLVSNLNEKQRSKTGQPLLVHFPRVGSVKPDLSKTSSIGKLQVLKPVRERNGVPLASPTSDSKALSSFPTAGQSIARSSSAMTPSINSGHPASERKHILPLLEKRALAESHIQSRSDFFSTMRKKSVSNSSSAPESNHVMSPSDKFSEGDNSSYPVSHQGGEDMVLSDINGSDSSETSDDEASEADSCSRQEYLNSGKNGLTYNSIFFTEEEEITFLRSLGWEENSEEGGLTDEEINAYYRNLTNKLTNAKPSSKIL